MRKRRPWGVRWGSGRRARANRCGRVETQTDDIETGVWHLSRDEPGGVPADWPGGVRHVDEASLICCFHVEREKACPDTVRPGGAGGRGSVPSGGNREGVGC